MKLSHKMQKYLKAFKPFDKKTKTYNEKIEAGVTDENIKELEKEYESLMKEYVFLKKLKGTINRTEARFKKKFKSRK